jgi:actin-related protein
MEHGVVTNWEDMERLWQFVYAEENLNLAPEGQPVSASFLVWLPSWEFMLLGLISAGVVN